MNIRTKSASIVAALALSITIGSGVVSAQSTTSATLDPSANPLGCTVVVTGATAINFGTFTWNGTTYIGTPTPGSVSLLVNTDEAPGTRDCPAVMVYGTDLQNGGTTAFPVGAISVGSVTALNTSTTPQQVVAANPAVPLGGAAATGLAVDLDESQVVNAAPTGVYGGTITFTIGDGLN